MTEPTFDPVTLGPAIGEPFPDATFLDTNGQPFDLHAERAGRPALVVFHRSARW